MDNLEDKSIYFFHKITIHNLMSVRYEVDHENELVYKSLTSAPHLIKTHSCEDDSGNLNFGLLFSEVVSDVLHLFKLSSPDDPFSLQPRPVLRRRLNISTMIRCQNCELHFPTKYQFQRHQCIFNAEKVVLKPNADVPDAQHQEVVRVKYDCPICGKQFVSKNNLERHEFSHANTERNTCEHCLKQFVSENRLRIHKENHCKKAGDVSKFYRSDVTVWKCLKCSEVFSSMIYAKSHTVNCVIENADGECSALINLQREIKSVEQMVLETGSVPLSLDVQDVEKILTEILLQCEFCNRTFADKTHLVEHQHRHTTSTNYECSHCEAQFVSYSVAAKHWVTKCTMNCNLFYLPRLTYCETCDRTFKTHELLYVHKIKKKHYYAKKHIVNVEDVLRKECVRELIEDMLKKLEASAIPIVEEPATDKAKEDGDKAPEEEKKDSDEDYEVDEAGVRKKKRKKKIKLTARYNKICSILQNGMMYQCERCDEVFNSIGKLDSHRKDKHVSSFTCEVCTQVLTTAKALVIHSRVHNSLKPYVCDTCGRSYSQTSHLWQHMRFHQGIKPFACPHEGCEARYTIRPDLKDHIRKVHTRERPFKCHVCNKCFLTGSVYYQHRLIHTNDRRYGCSVCLKRFFRADALNNHRRIHTDERPYPCGMCERSFRQKGDRNKHLRSQHPQGTEHEPEHA